MSELKKFVERMVGILRTSVRLLSPAGEAVVVYFPHGCCFGTMQSIYPHDSSIVHLSKPTRNYIREIGDEILRVAPEFRQLDVVPGLSLEGRLHIARLEGNTLYDMTPEQKEYVLLHPPRIIDPSSVQYH